MTEKEITRAALIMLLRRKRQGMTPAERARRKKPARWLYPWAAEHGYAVLIRAWVKPVIVFVREYIQKHHEAVLRGDGADAVIRNDAVAGESFQLMFESLWNWCDLYITNKDNEKAQSQIWMGLGRIADEAFDFNEAQYDKSFKASLGINFPADQSWWPAARDLWRERNYEIIRSDIRKYISDINAVTERAVTNGLSVKSLMKEIHVLDEKITKHRANFIARDQIGKLNGKIAQKRQEDIGLTMYEWSTSGDERVRGNPSGHFPGAKPSHYLMDGLLCRWDDATVYSADGGKTWKPRPAGAVMLHPGQDYQCRCCALAWFDELIDEADGVETGTYYEREVKTNDKTVEKTSDCDVIGKCGQDFYDKTFELEQKCENKTLAKIWNANEKDLKIGNINEEEDCAYFSPSKGTVNFNLAEVKRGTEYRQPYQTYFHEGAHAMDTKFAKRGSGQGRHYSMTYKGGLFPKTIKKEVDDYVMQLYKSMKSDFDLHKSDFDYLKSHNLLTNRQRVRWESLGEKPKFTKGNVYEHIKKELENLPQKQMSAISDIFSGATLNKVKDGGYHDTSYWKDAQSGNLEYLATEANSHFFETVFANKESYGTIKKYLPESEKVWVEMMGELAKNSEGVK